MKLYIVLFTLLITFVIVFIVLAIFISRNNTNTTTPTEFNLKQFYPGWSPGYQVGPCKGIYFPPSSETSLGVPSLSADRIDNAVTLSQPQCLWPDTENAALYSRKCITQTCTGFDGNSYQSGQSEYYYNNCSCQGITNCVYNTECSGNLVVLTLGNQGSCLSASSDDNSTSLTECNLQDDGQIFIAYYSQSRKIFNLQNRKNGKWLVEGGSGSIVQVSDQPTVYSWCIIDGTSVRSLTGNSIADVLTQIAYIGFLSSDTITPLESITSNTELLDVVYRNNCLSITQTSSMNLFIWHPLYSYDTLQSRLTSVRVI